jgi:hypothetical protein
MVAFAPLTLKLVMAHPFPDHSLIASARLPT